MTSRKKKPAAHRRTPPAPPPPPRLTDESRYHRRGKVFSLRISDGDRATLEACAKRRGDRAFLNWDGSARLGPLIMALAIEAASAKPMRKTVRR
jgi:hypothetical protein